MNGHLSDLIGRESVNVNDWSRETFVIKQGKRERGFWLFVSDKRRKRREYYGKWIKISFYDHNIIRRRLNWIKKSNVLKLQSDY